MVHQVSTLTETDRQLIQTSQVFLGVCVEDMEHMYAECEIQEIPSGATLIQPNTSNENFYIVLSGKLHVYLDESIVNHYVTLRPGECVGELSIIDGGSTSALVVASTDCRIMCIHEEVLWQLVRTANGVTRNLMYVLAKRVRNANQAIINGAHLQQELEHTASIDSLTGLFNRRWMNEYFQRQIGRALKDNKPLVLLLADLDHFKQINDTHGHIVGDDVLCAVASVLSQHIRPSDLLARFGGEEFALILPETSMAEALQVAERIRAAMEITRIAVKDSKPPKEIQLTLSLGIANLALGDSMETLLERADKALYRAKDNGRNRIECC
jgi:diguanylate cyclase (GGDEF)-like protein